MSSLFVKKRPPPVRPDLTSTTYLPRNRFTRPFREQALTLRTSQKQPEPKIILLTLLPHNVAGINFPNAETGTGIQFAEKLALEDTSIKVDNSYVISSQVPYKSKTCFYHPSHCLCKKNISNKIG